MLVVTGTQRSGTSMIAKCFIEMGYDLGTSLWDEEVQGGYESEHICSFYRSYLGDPRFPFADFELSEYLNPDYIFSQLDLPVVKFSYLLMNPAFGTIWSKFRPDSGDVFLVMNRNKEDVVSSKRRLMQRFAYDSRLLCQSPTTLEENFVMSLDYLMVFYRAEVLNFPWCLDHLEAVNTKLSRLGWEVPIPSAVWNSVVDKNKVHF